MTTLNAKTPHELVSSAGFLRIKPGDTYFALVGTIIGPESLTAVFGMGTGVSPSLWSPKSFSSIVMRRSI